MWKIQKINSHCFKWLKNDQEAIIIYKEGALWKGHVLGAAHEVSAHTYAEVAELVIKIAKDCGWD